MKVHAWFKKRGIRFIAERARRLNERYGLRSGRSIKSIEHFVQELEQHNCHPTFAVPGIVVERNLPFIRRLQDRGAEIAVHGYNHVDLKVYPPENASSQLTSAAELFRASGLEVHGFRCPYLSITDELIKAIPPGVFEYSSNRAIQWPLRELTGRLEGSLFAKIRGFYLPSKAETNLCVPWEEEGLLEIPVCVPDDLQLHDGLGYRQEDIARGWSYLLSQTYRRGELLNLMFHPELASFCEVPFASVLEEAVSLRPAVWIARLCEISAWWNEKSTFRVRITEDEDSVRIDFTCSDRATILARGIAGTGASNSWDGYYERLKGHEFILPAHPRPFVGLPMHTPPATLSFLREQGYIVETGSTASGCGIYIDGHTLAGLTNQMRLINHIEAAPGPLIRLWRWPDAYKSAMCITGDLDALTLLDYATRLLTR